MSMRHIQMKGHFVQKLLSETHTGTSDRVLYLDHWSYHRCKRQKRHGTKCALSAKHAAVCEMMFQKYALAGFLEINGLRDIDHSFTEVVF